MDLIYPKTKHLVGSKGIVERDHVALADMPGPLLTVEEKLDGIQVAICFEHPHHISLTTRSGPLPSTPVFSRFAAWAWERYSPLLAVLGTRYILWGEWLYAKHTMFYDQLESYFYEYDIFDRENDQWLSTPRRHALLQGTDIVSVPVLYRGQVSGVDLNSFLKPSLYQSDHLRESLQVQCAQHKQDFSTVWAETADIPTEGLFVKSETDEVTLGWYKYIRPGFVETIQKSGSHWRDRPVLPNMLKGH